VALGELEQAVLFGLLRLEGEAHGAALIRELEDRAGRRVAAGALYTVLERLQDKGYVEAWIGDSTPERGGRRRKVYRILPAGARELRSWYRSLQDLAEGTTARLDALAGEAG
jgi:DNA-binding PadR family transcriptional regulator